MTDHTSSSSDKNQNNSRRPGVPRLLTWLILIGLVCGCALGEWLHGYQRDPADVQQLEQIISGADPVAAGLELDAEPDMSTQEAQAELDRLDARHGVYEGWRTGLWFVGNDIFIRLLKMLIVPLIVSSIIVGVTAVGDFRGLGRIGIKTLVYYFATMLIAVTIGLTLVSNINPGGRMEAADIEEGERVYQADTTVQQKIEKAPGGFGEAVLQILRSIIPKNPIGAAASGNVLPLIFFSLFFGIVLTTIGERGNVVSQFFEAVFHIRMRMVHVVIWVAPVGVFSLLAWTVAAKGLGVFVSAISVYMLTVIAGLSIHGLIVLPLILLLFARVNPIRFIHQMRSALMTAFGTDSSSATLPVTMDAAVQEGGCSRKAAGFVLPLGATINMDGTALFESVAVVFIAQAYGFQLALPELIIVALTATLTAIGAAGIPSASLVLMPTVILAVNQSLGHGGDGVGESSGILIAGIGMIIGVDRILDMCRTTVNVWGDAVGAKIISRTEPDSPAET